MALHALKPPDWAFILNRLYIHHHHYFIWKFIEFFSSLKVRSKHEIIFGSITLINVFLIAQWKRDVNMHVFLYYPPKLFRFFYFSACPTKAFNFYSYINVPCFIKLFSVGSQLVSKSEGSLSKRVKYFYLCLKKLIVHLNK
jgi:hypothetical protein